MTGLLRSIPVVLAILVHGAPALTVGIHPPTTGSGTYVARSLNRKSLPVEERVSSTDGYAHWVRVEKLILRLQADGRFSVSMSYYHEHLRPKERPVPSQLLEAANRGTYSVRGEEIVFVPAAKSGRSPKPVSGERSGDQIEVKFRLREGDHWRPMTVIAIRDRSYW